jgi:hypothetical protein
LAIECFERLGKKAVSPSLLIHWQGNPFMLECQCVDAYGIVRSTAHYGVRMRDQVMKHDPFPGVFNGAYINHTVRFNVQDTFLESDISDDGLTRAFTHMSIRCNPGAPKEVPNEVMERLFAAHPDIVDLEQRFKALSTEIEWEYKFIKRPPGEKRKEHEDLRKQRRSEKSTKTFASSSRMRRKA